MKTAEQHAMPGNSSTINRYERIMLVDDNSMDNFINKRLIESCGFAGEVITCQSAAEGLAYLGKGDNLPGVIFLDINMPEMNGFEFLDAFGKLTADLHRECRIVMLSTSESFKDLNRANKNRFVRKFLNKPLTVEVLNAIKV